MVPPTSAPKKHRSRAGCLTCRRRKLKCNEIRPECLNCSKSNLECVWPTGSMVSLPHGSDFKVRRNRKRIGTDFIFYDSLESDRQGKNIWKNGRNGNGNVNKNVDEIFNAMTRRTRKNTREMNKINNGNNNGANGLTWINNDFNRVNNGLNNGYDGKSKDEMGDGVVPDVLTYDSSMFTGALLTNTFTDYMFNFSSNNFITGGACSRCEESLDMDNEIVPILSTTRFEEILDTLLVLESFSPAHEDSEKENESLIENYDQSQLLGLTPLTGAGSVIFGVDYNAADSQFLHVFVHGFMPAISPQHCHPKLMPISVFMPQGVLEPIMREVFYACGAAFMSGINPELQDVLRRRYASCLQKFANRLTETGGEIEEWMVAAALLFTLRDKFTGSTPALPTLHLAKAIELIRILRAKIGDNSVTIKFFVESFLFNYSMVLITGGPLVMKMLPSPFEMFEEWRPVSEFQPFDCIVPWMNNPVFGAAKEAFELAAKALWLVSRCPLSDSDMVVACDLLAQSYRVKRPELIVAPGVKILLAEFVQLQESIAVSDVSRLACQLLLLRMINPNIELLHVEVTTRVEQLMKILRTLSLDTPLWVICGWLLLVTGLSSVLSEDRSFIRQACYRSALFCHAAFLVQIAEFMEIAWGTDDCPGPGWNLLFNPSASHSICL